MWKAVSAFGPTITENNGRHGVTTVNEIGDRAIVANNEAPESASETK